jgi:hypothetical protein
MRLLQHFSEYSLMLGSLAPCLMLGHNHALSGTAFPQVDGISPYALSLRLRMMSCLLSQTVDIDWLAYPHEAPITEDSRTLSYSCSYVQNHLETLRSFNSYPYTFNSSRRLRTDSGKASISDVLGIQSSFSSSYCTWPSSSSPDDLSS